MIGAATEDGLGGRNPKGRQALQESGAGRGVEAWHSSPYNVCGCPQSGQGVSVGSTHARVGPIAESRAL